MSMFKQFYTKPIPPDAKPVTFKNRPAVKFRDSDGEIIIALLTKDGTRCRIPSKKWYADIGGKRIALAEDRSAAKVLLGRLTQKAELAGVGVVDPHEEHRLRPLAEHVTEWEATLKAKNRDSEYVELKLNRVREIIRECKFLMPDDLDATRLELFLGALRGARSIQTVNDWQQAIRQFTHWMMKRHRIARDPFEHLKRENAEKDRKHVRRALTVDELRILVANTKSSKTIIRKLSGPSRAMLYMVAAYTGLRAAELSTLCPEHFGEIDGAYGVGRSGADTKNGQVAFQTLPTEVADAVRQFVRGLPTGVPIWNSTWHERGADMIRADAGEAGLQLDIQTPTGIRVLDFHSLRGTLGLMLETANIPLKTRQTILRHSDPRLTLNRYTNLSTGAAARAIDTLPSIFSEPDPLTVLLTVNGEERRGESRTIEETSDHQESGEVDDDGMPEPLEMNAKEGNRGRSKTFESGEGGIRTRGAVLPARRFSKAVLSTTQPPLRRFES
jgi:integrase